LTSLIVESLNEVLIEHGIYPVKENNDIELLTSILDVLYKASELYDAGYILTNINFNIDDSRESIDILNDLMVLLSSYGNDEVYDIIDRIDDTLLSKLHHILSNKDIPDVLDGIQTDIITRYRDYLNGRRFGVVFNGIKNGLPIGQLDIEDLVNILGEDISNINPKYLGFELISLALVSSITDINEGLRLVSGYFSQDEVSANLLYNTLLLERGLKR
jgi:hypothetical protein